LRDHDRPRAFQCMRPVTVNHRRPEHIQHGLIAIRKPLLVDLFGLSLRPDFVAASAIEERRGHEPAGLLHLRKFGLHRPGKPWFLPDTTPDAAVVTHIIIDDPVEAVAVWIVPVIAQLVPDVQRDEQTGGDPQRKTAYLDKGIQLLFPQLAERDLPVIAEHGKWFWYMGKDGPGPRNVAYLWPP